MLARFLTLNVFMTASNKTHKPRRSRVTKAFSRDTYFGTCNHSPTSNLILDQATASSPNIRSLSGTLRHWDPCLNPSLSCRCLLTQSLLEKCAGFAIAEEARVLLHCMTGRGLRKCDTLHDIVVLGICFSFLFGSACSLISMI